MFDITKPINPTSDQLKKLNEISSKVSNDLSINWISDKIQEEFTRRAIEEIEKTELKNIKNIIMKNATITKLAEFLKRCPLRWDEVEAFNECVAEMKELFESQN